MVIRSRPYLAARWNIDNPSFVMAVIGKLDSRITLNGEMEAVETVSVSS